MQPLYLSLNNLDAFAKAIDKMRPRFVAVGSLDSAVGVNQSITSVSARFHSENVIVSFDAGPNIDGASYVQKIREAADTLGIPVYSGVLSMTEPPNAVGLHAATIKQQTDAGTR